MSRRYWLPYEETKWHTFTHYDLERKNRLTVWSIGGYMKAWRHPFQPKGVEYFNTAKEAMTDLDKCILAFGDYIIPDNKVREFREKLLVLL